MAAGASFVATATFLSLIEPKSTLNGITSARKELRQPQPPASPQSVRPEYFPSANTWALVPGLLFPPGHVPPKENMMGILDTISQLAGQAGDAAQGDQAKVAGGFIKALTDHPEGIQGVLA